MAVSPENPFNTEPTESLSNEKMIDKINADTESEYLAELKKKNKNYLVKGLGILEKERIASKVIQLYEEARTKHEEKVKDYETWDEVWRMERMQVTGDDGSMPNYRSPLTTVAMETIHSTIMNVFFTPEQIVRALPTEEGDVPKVKKLDTFANWSVKNELMIFEACDRLFHYSAKIGEAPYLVHWVKEYGTEIRREILTNPANPEEVLYDPDTKEPLFQEVEEQKLLYNAPQIETLSRKDYI